MTKYKTVGFKSTLANILSMIIRETLTQMILIRLIYLASKLVFTNTESSWLSLDVLNSVKELKTYFLDT